MQNSSATSISQEEYLRSEVVALYKSEFHRGEVVAMAGAQPRHNIIEANLIALLNFCLRNSSCIVYSSNQLVYAPGCISYYYPDITVACAEPDYQKSPGGLDALLNPTILIEVLSDSTETFDRTEKFNCYRSIESLHQYVLVAQKEMLVESYVKIEIKEWHFRYENEPAKTIKIGSCDVLLTDIYQKIVFNH